MILRRRKTQKQQDSNISELLAGVVSLYLFMARNAHHRGKEISFIDHLLRSMFGSEIPLYQIEEARNSVLSVREAANCLNNLLSPGDRIKIILNLISLAYHERSKIQVLGSVEVVELADLLRLDVNLLESIYNLFEGKSKSISLPEELTRADSGMLHNSMVWNDGPGALKAEINLHFVMIDKLLLARNDGEDELWIHSSQEKRLLAGKDYHLIDVEDQLSGKDWQLYYQDIWQIYREQKKLTSLAEFLEHKRQSKDKEICRDDYYVDVEAQAVAISFQKSARSMLQIFRKQECWYIQPLQECDCRVNKKILQARQVFTQNSDVLNLAGRNYILNRHWELIEIPLQIGELRVCDLRHRFKEGNTALKGISFTLREGSLTAIMGPSGSGKTTLLQVLLGELKAERAVIQIDGMDFARHYAFFQPFIGYVPQDDLLFANLSVYENLWYKLKLCLPELRDLNEIRSRIDNLLKSVDLYDQRDMIVGDVMNKKLSGGQRRRLNIALELVMGPAILILDEPTSGLSSKDSESIVDLLAELRDQGKIIISTIHQPNACIYSRFDNLLLMDKGGVQIYFGAVEPAFDYFAEEQNLVADAALKQKRQLLMPEYFFDLIEYRNPNNSRRFPPEYWDQKYRDFSFLKLMEPAPSPRETTEREMRERRSFLHGLRNLGLLIRRNFLNKRRSRLNLIMTLLVSPLLAFITAFVLRSVGEGMSYSYYENQNAMLFDFIAIIIFIFIGLANSIDDILSEKRIIKREMKMRVGAFCQLSSKHMVLFVMTCIQAGLFYFFAMLILDMRGFFLPKFGFYLLAGMCGYSLGLLFSGIIKDRATVINILPLVIIPQIMFSGAVIEFSRMNPGLKLNQHRVIPEFCQVIPSRWLYEGIVIGSVRYNGRQLHQQAHHKRYQKIKDAGALDARLHIEMADNLNNYLEAHPTEQYSNKYATLLVNTAQGRYSSLQRNTFMSYRSHFGKHEFDTLWLDVAASLMIVFVAGLITLIRMRYYF